MPPDIHLEIWKESIKTEVWAERNSYTSHPYKFMSPAFYYHLISVTAGRFATNNDGCFIPELR